MTDDTADWVAVELEAGTTYQIGLSGRGEDNPAADTVLTLRDSKGGMIDMNDDINSLGGGPAGDANLNSSLKFRPTEDGTYYIDASSYSRIPGDDNSGDYMITVEALDLPADIVGTNDRREDRRYGRIRVDCRRGWKRHDRRHGRRRRD